MFSQLYLLYLGMVYNPSDQYSLKAKVKRGHCLYVVGSFALVFSFSTYFVYKFWLTPWPTTFDKVFTSLCLLTSLVSGIGLKYFASLSLAISDVVLRMDSELFTDFASPFAFGPIPRQEIQTIKIVNFMGFDLLEVQLSKKSTLFYSTRTWRSFCNQLYRLVFGKRFFIPLTVLKISRQDLETQLVHFSNLKRKELKQTKRPNLKLIQTTVPDLPPPTPEMRKSSREFFAKVDPKLGAEPVPNAAPQAQLIQNQYLWLCDLYLEHIARFTYWVERSSPRIPNGVQNIRQISKSQDYEEVQFAWMGQVFQFGLRREVADGEALLSVSMGGTLNLTLRVRVEIGTLEPLEVEQIIAGDWLEQLQSLYDLIQATENKKEKSLDESGQER